MATREYLIEVFEDTTQLVLNGEYDSDLKSAKLNSKDYNSINSDKFTKSGNITVDNIDCILQTKKFSKLGKTCVLNMASYKKPGGGVRSGSRAQEEELSRRSNLVFGLPSEHYPLSMDSFIYTKGVTFFKDGNYNICDEFNSDVITVAAINLSVLSGTYPPKKPSNYDEVMLSKIRSMIIYPFLKGCSNIVLSAFGCGVFKNDPTYVAELFKEVLVGDRYANLYDNVSFAIINDHNSVSNNFSKFSSVFKN